MRPSVTKRDFRPWVLKLAPLSRVVMLLALPVVPVACAVVIVWRERAAIIEEMRDVLRSAIGRWV